MDLAGGMETAYHDPMSLQVRPKKPSRVNPDDVGFLRKRGKGPRNYQQTVQITEDEHKAIETVASAYGMTVSTFVRNSILFHLAHIQEVIEGG